MPQKLNDLNKDVYDVKINVERSEDVFLRRDREAVLAEDHHLSIVDEVERHEQDNKCCVKEMERWERRHY